jgi:hypothetical protein
MNTTQRPTPITDAAFEAFSRGACGTVYLCFKMAELERFIADMGHRPPGTTLTRSHGSTSYGPGCCVWAATNPPPITP